MADKILITGAAGFIGYHLSQKLIQNNFDIYGIDNLNNYYDVNLKKDRLNILSKYSNLLLNELILRIRIVYLRLSKKYSLR